MRTAEEMLTYAKQRQLAELKQYKKGFQAISEKLSAEETAVFSMVAESLVQKEGWRECWNPWHVALVVTNTRILAAGETIRGRFMTFYEVESYNLTDVVSIEQTNGKILINLNNKTLILEGKQLSSVFEALKEYMG